MRLALTQARQAFDLGEVPVGAVLARDGDVVATGFNQPIRAVDPTAHAEVVAIREAAHKIGNYRLGPMTLYVTVEPCIMCIGAIVHARVTTLVYGASEPKFGAVASILDLNEISIPHRLEVESGVLEQECKQILKDFFAYRRQNV